MIYDDDIPGVTHPGEDVEKHIRSEAPYIAPGTPENHELLEDILGKELEHKKIKKFVDERNDLYKRVEIYLAEVKECLYLLDNPEEGSPEEHIEHLDYLGDQVRKAYDSLMEDEALGLETPDSLDEYIKGIETATEEIADRWDSKET